MNTFLLQDWLLVLKRTIKRLLIKNLRVQVALVIRWLFICDWWKHLCKDNIHCFINGLGFFYMRACLIGRYLLHKTRRTPVHKITKAFLALSLLHTYKKPFGFFTTTTNWHLVGFMSTNFWKETNLSLLNDNFFAQSSPPPQNGTFYVFLTESRTIGMYKCIEVIWAQPL